MGRKGGRRRGRPRRKEGGIWWWKWHWEGVRLNASLPDRPPAYQPCLLHHASQYSSDRYYSRTQFPAGMCVDRATAPTRIVLPNYVPANVVATCSRWRVRRDTREEGKERKESHTCRLCTSNRTDEYVRHATVAPPAMDPPGITALVSHECPWTTQPVRTSAVAAGSQLLDSAVPRRPSSDTFLVFCPLAELWNGRERRWMMPRVFRYSKRD